MSIGAHLDIKADNSGRIGAKGTPKTNVTIGSHQAIQEYGAKISVTPEISDNQCFSQTISVI